MLSDRVLRDMAGQLCGVRGVRAVALGGSRARGMHRPDSDADLGLYVEGDVDRAAVEQLAAQWTGRPVPMSPSGGWGPWVDSGAWLDVDGVAVDLIVRDIGRVAEQCGRARRGEFAFHAQPGHPLGFLDVAYAGEVATCVPLCDPDRVLDALAHSVMPYPEPLRDAMLRNLWQADFLLDGAEKAAKREDTVYVSLCLSTVALLLAHGWHAAAGKWVTNEKGLVPNVARLPLGTGGFSAIAASVLSAPGKTEAELLTSIAELRHAPRPGRVEAERR